MQVEKYIKDGQVAILYSPEFGAGWSTWSEKELAYDKRVVEFYLEHKDDDEYMHKLSNIDSKETYAAKELFKKWGYDYVYFGGFEDIRMIYLPEGTEFIIDEYDGSESIITASDMNWSIA